MSDYSGLTCEELDELINERQDAFDKQIKLCEDLQRKVDGEAKAYRGAQTGLQGPSDAIKAAQAIKNSQDSHVKQGGAYVKNPAWWKADAELAKAKTDLSNAQAKVDQAREGWDAALKQMNAEADRVHAMRTDLDELYEARQHCKPAVKKSNVGGFIGVVIGGAAVVIGLGFGSGAFGGHMQAGPGTSSEGEYQQLHIPRPIDVVTPTPTTVVDPQSPPPTAPLGGESNSSGGGSGTPEVKSMKSMQPTGPMTPVTSPPQSMTETETRTETGSSDGYHSGDRDRQRTERRTEDSYNGQRGQDGEPGQDGTSETYESGSYEGESYEGESYPR